MSYSTPLTAVANVALTAAQWNASVRDNLLVTPAALATQPGEHMVARGANDVLMRIYSTNSANSIVTVTSTSYTTAGGLTPQIASVAHHNKVMVGLKSYMSNSGTGACWYSFNITGAHSLSADDARAIQFAGSAAVAIEVGATLWLEASTPGTVTYTAYYRVGSGTGTYTNRTVWTLPF